MAQDDTDVEIPDDSTELETGLVGEERERWLALQPDKERQEQHRLERAGKKSCNPAARAEILGNAFSDHLRGLPLDE